MEIQLCGTTVLIDHEDYEKVKAIKWHIKDVKKSMKGEYYFCHTESKNGRRNIYLHRFIVGAGEYSGIDVDHINGDRLDNRKSNLRICEHKHNTWNRKISRKNTTGFKGVCMVGNKYRARIRKDNKFIHLGYYASPELAYAAYCEASNKYHGEYGRTL